MLFSRACPGRELADATLFAALAMSISVFDVSKMVDPTTGKTIEPRCEFVNSLVRYFLIVTLPHQAFAKSVTNSSPKPFVCKIAPRSDVASQLIQSVEDEHPFGIGDAEELTSVVWK